jgi:hypothetical protein
MILLRYLTAALVTVSMVGCCCSRCVVTDPCDPCGVTPAHQCCLSRLWSMPRSFGFSWNNACTCGGCQCGCGGGELTDYGYGDMGGCAGSCAAPAMSSAPSSSGCNCSQSATYSNGPASYGGAYYPPSTYSPSTSGSVPSPSGTPQPIPEVPPSYNPLPNAPLPPVNSAQDSTTLMIPPPSGQQPQMVSYEEFQRLPGNVISGPGSSPAPTTASPPALTPSTPSPIQQASAVPQALAVPPLPTPTAIRAQRSAVSSVNQQAVWAPSKAK